MLIGTYKEPSFNQTMFCFDVNPPDRIKIWREDMEGNEVDDGWWEMEITPSKFHWLVDEWNNGHVKKVYRHWWEKVDTRKEHINSLLQLNHEELTEVFNYAAYVWPHHRWKGELHLDSNLRPLWHRGKIIKYEYITREEANILNEAERKAKKYRADQNLWGYTDSEAIAKAIKEAI